MKDENISRLIIGFVLIVGTVLAIPLSGMLKYHLGLSTDGVVSIPVEEFNMMMTLSIFIIGICGATCVAVLLTINES